MTTTYTVTLMSDAEPGTGLGSMLVDDYVPRDAEGRPFLPASHLRGLLRERLRELGRRIDFEGCLDDAILGREGPESTDEGLLHLSDASLLPSEAGYRTTGVQVVARTALNQDGTAEGTRSLRSTESLAVGQRFRGTLVFKGQVTNFARDCVLLALRTIPAVGGGRTRGSGACVIDLDAEDRSVRSLLEGIAGDGSRALISSAPVSSAAADVGKDLTLLRLNFQAESAICCPETPVLSGINVIRSGPVIPASSVQGAILWRLNAVDPALADRCFEDPRFRAWPLQPYRNAAQASIRAPLCLRLSSRASAGELDTDSVLDASLGLKPDLARTTVKYSSADGFLMAAEDRRTLLRARDLKRVLTAHKVAQLSHGGDAENVFSVEALAPTRFQGLVALPSRAAEVILESLQKDPVAFFGKSRSVRGRGTLTAERVEGSAPWEFRTKRKMATVLVVQSPIVLPETQEAGVSLEDQSRSLLAEWCRERGLPEAADLWVAGAVRFGWSRNGSSGRTQPRRVLLPGSTIRLVAAADPEKLATALLAGLGGGRREGYGALAVHPGVPSRLHGDTARLAKISSPYAAVMPVVERLAGTPGPSKSQVAALQNRLRAGKGEARSFLRHQLSRGSRVRRVWEPVEEPLNVLLGLEVEAGLLADAMTTWIDLLAAKEVAS